MKLQLKSMALRTGAVVVVASLIALSLHAETNTVSLPAGFVRVLIPSQSEVLLSVPFDLLPSPDINDALYGQLAGSTNESSADVVRKWDAVGCSYNSAYKADGVGSPNDGIWFGDFSTWSTSSLSILPGEGFFIGNRQSTTQSVFICGLVVLDEAYAVPLFSGFNLFGSPYPAQSINDAAFVVSGAQGANPASDGDQITDYAAGLNYWLLSDTNSPNHLKWVNTNGVVSTLDLNTGAGFWYWRRGTNGFNWTENRPYSDPFPTNAAPPAVQDMYPNASGDEVTLDIQATGDSGELLEVYYKDLSTNDIFTSYNWLIAVTGLESVGSNAVYWVDAGSTNRPVVSSVHSRYYLVGRGDIDQDSDALPDSRETFVHGTDATLYDTDGDTLGDGDELSVYGSNPLLSDTDNDGMHDGNEVGYGKNPANSNTYSRVPFFEDFETNTVAAGDIDGQNGWEASPVNSALVQTNIVYEGSQALTLSTSNVPPSTLPTVRHLFASPETSKIWVDMWVQVFDAPLNISIDDSALLMFGCGGQLRVSDGYSLNTNGWTSLTNAVAISEGHWVRVTLCSDYARREWLVCLGGVKLAEGLGFVSDTVDFSSVTFSGIKGYVDGIVISQTRPEGVLVDDDEFLDSKQSGAQEDDLDGRLRGLNGDAAHRRTIAPKNSATAQFVYADSHAGANDYDGLSASWDGAHGPKATLGAAVDLVTSASLVYVASGTYTNEPSVYSVGTDRIVRIRVTDVVRITK